LHLANGQNHRPVKHAGYIGCNTSDPHRPYPGSEQEKEEIKNLRKDCGFDLPMTGPSPVPMV
jgi:hypothetical protein